MGLKENVIVGHKIPAGSGLREYEDIIVGSKEEYDAVMGGNENESELVEAETEDLKETKD